MKNGGLLGGCLSRADRHRQGLAQEPRIGETLVFQILVGLPSGFYSDLMEFIVILMEFYSDLMEFIVI